MQYVIRTAKSTDRVTKGKRYILNYVDSAVAPRIIDDNGRYMTPTLANPDYWKYSDTETKKETLNAPKGKTMLTIENVTLINGTSHEDMSVQSIINLMVQERDQAEELSALNIDSKAIKKLIVKHQDNLAKLIELLDSK